MMSTFTPQTLPQAERQSADLDARRDEERRPADEMSAVDPFANVFADAVARQDERPEGGAREGGARETSREGRKERPEGPTKQAQNTPEEAEQVATASAGAEGASRAAAKKNDAVANDRMTPEAAFLLEGMAGSGRRTLGAGSRKTAGRNGAASTSKAGAATRNDEPSLATAGGDSPALRNTERQSAGLREIADGMRALKTQTPPLASNEARGAEGSDGLSAARNGTIDVGALRNEAAPLRLDAMAPVRSPLPARVDTPPAWEQALDRAQALALNGGGDTRLALRPDGLGHLNLRVRVVEGRVMVTVVAENAEATSLLLRDAERLTQALEVQGFDEADLDVRTGDPHEQYRERPEGEEPEGRAAEDVAVGPALQAKDLVPPTKKHNGILDVVA